MKYTLLIFLNFSLISCNLDLFLKEKLLRSFDEPVEIPFYSWKNGILIEVEINGQVGLFLFDNGFSQSAINPEFASKAKIKFKKTRNINDANRKKQSLLITRIKEAKISGQTFLNTKFYQLDTKTFAPCIELDGIIGASIINLINWEINNTSNTIKMSSIAFDNEGFKFQVEFLGNNQSQTDITVNDVEIKTIIDFGAISTELVLNKELHSIFFRDFNAITNIGSYAFSTHGIGKPITWHLLSNKFKVKNNENTFPIESNMSLVEGTKHQGVLGATFFDNYNIVTINSTKKEYILSGLNSPIKPSFANTKTYGIVLHIIDDEWKVIRKEKQNPLLREIELYSIVKFVDDIEISQINICEFEKFLNSKIEKKEDLIITFEDERVLILPFQKPKLSNLPLN